MKKLLNTYSKDHKKAQLLRHAAVADRKRQKRNLRLPARMKMNKKKRRRKKRTEAFKDALEEDGTNTSDLSFEGL